MAQNQLSVPNTTLERLANVGKPDEEKEKGKLTKFLEGIQSVVKGVNPLFHGATPEPGELPTGADIANSQLGPGGGGIGGILTNLARGRATTRLSRIDLQNAEAERRAQMRNLAARTDNTEAQTGLFINQQGLLDIQKSVQEETLRLLNPRFELNKREVEAKIAELQQKVALEERRLKVQERNAKTNEEKLVLEREKEQWNQLRDTVNASIDALRLGLEQKAEVRLKEASDQARRESTSRIGLNESTSEAQRALGLKRIQDLLGTGDGGDLDDALDRANSFLLFSQRAQELGEPITNDSIRSTLKGLDFDLGADQGILERLLDPEGQDILPNRDAGGIDGAAFREAIEAFMAETGQLPEMEDILRFMELKKQN